MHVTLNRFTKAFHLDGKDATDNMWLGFLRGQLISPDEGYRLAGNEESYDKLRQGAFVWAGMGVGLNLEQ